MSRRAAPADDHATAPSGEHATAAANQPTSLPLELAAELVDWYREAGRDLPWRRTRDPYAILVSEIMLQQTRVETVLGRYESFLERFPTIAALAAAEVGEVLTEWSGLGYYRRARSLHQLARVVVADHGGRIPEDLGTLRALPGLGPYTAAAVGSISFGIAALSVDGNVGRALCRIAGIVDDPRRGPVRRQLEELVADAMQKHEPADLNQAIMELGARVCTPRSPACDECPAASWCAAHAQGIEELIPPIERETVRAVTELAAVIEHDGRVLLLRGQRPTLVQDMWEFPTLDSRIGASRATKSAFSRHLADLGWHIDLGAKLGEIKHGMTNRRIECRVYEGRLADQQEARSDGSRQPPERGSEITVREPELNNTVATESGWFRPQEATELPLAASARKILTEVLGETLKA